MGKYIMKNYMLLYVISMSLLLPCTALALTHIDAADNYWQEGDIKQATKYYHKALRDNPNSVIALVGIARCNLIQGYDEMAQDTINKALKINSNDVSGLFVQAKLQLRRKEYGSAKTTLQALLAINSEYLDAYPLLSSALYSLGDAEGADQVFETLKTKQAVIK